MESRKYNLLVTLNAGYLSQLAVMLKSVVLSNPDARFDVYVLHSTLTEADFAHVQNAIGSGSIVLHPILVSDPMLKTAPTSKRYPTEMYFRLFASRYLPKELDRILYLDPDIIVVNPLEKLYDMPLENHFYAACSHILIQGMQRFNEWRLNMEKDTPYINSGVLLMNLGLLRKEMDPEEVYGYIRRHKQALLLPDQDVLSALYGMKTLLVDSLVYNLSERYQRACNIRLLPGETKVDLDWIRKNAVIIHYCGKNKPWKANYLGELNVFYDEIVRQVHY
jgi:lipopolysaccharide biosynthesis glycosyltransferase